MDFLFFRMKSDAALFRKGSLVDSQKSSPEGVKPGDKVRLKKLDNWVTSRDAAMTVKHVGEFPEKGIALGALCEWINAQGHSHERVYSLEELLPLAIEAAKNAQAPGQAGSSARSGTAG